jgi:hypothetical protein
MLSTLSLGKWFTSQLSLKERRDFYSNLHAPEPIRVLGYMPRGGGLGPEVLA